MRGKIGDHASRDSGENIEQLVPKFRRCFAWITVVAVRHRGDHRDRVETSALQPLKRKFVSVQTFRARLYALEFHKVRTNRAHHRGLRRPGVADRKSTRLNSSHVS